MVASVAVEFLSPTGDGAGAFLVAPIGVLIGILAAINDNPNARS